jgi:hypothetical protein
MLVVVLLVILSFVVPEEGILLLLISPSSSSYDVGDKGPSLPTTSLLLPPLLLCGRLLNMLGVEMPEDELDSTNSLLVSLSSPSVGSKVPVSALVVLVTL